MAWGCCDPGLMLKRESLYWLNMGKKMYVIGSRGSKLALWQSEWVKAQLEAAAPNSNFRIELIKTSGDVNTRMPLSVIGGQGVFTKEIEEALLSERVDIGVHSLKDLPTVHPEGLTIAAITKREDPRDALVLPQDSTIAVGSIEDIPQGSRIGSSSQRRGAQLRSRRPNLVLMDIRGNVDTRLRKLDQGEYDALILACAGLRRLGLVDRISMPISIDEMLPAVGQGALAIEMRGNDSELFTIVSVLDDVATRAACTAERAFLRALGGGCQLPIAGHATVEANILNLRGLVASTCGGTVIADSVLGPISDAARLGEQLGQTLLGRGVMALLGAADQR
jgi:hydroxymethylbilane synthase